MERDLLNAMRLDLEKNNKHSIAYMRCITDTQREAFIDQLINNMNNVDLLNYIDILHARAAQ